MSIQLLIVDDHEIIREGLRGVLASTEVEIVEAVNGETALGVLVNQQVHVVLLDIDMPDCDGLQVLRRIKQQYPGLPVLMHSCHDRPCYIERSIKLGAAGYLIKSPDPTPVIEAIRTVWNGGNVWTSKQLRHAVSDAGLRQDAVQ